MSDGRIYKESGRATMDEIIRLRRKLDELQREVTIASKYQELSSSVEDGTKGGGVSTASADLRYLKLAADNDPLTGSLETLDIAATGQVSIFSAASPGLLVDNTSTDVAVTMRQSGGGTVTLTFSISVTEVTNAANTLNCFFESAGADLSGHAHRTRLAAWSPESGFSTNSWVQSTDGDRPWYGDPDGSHTPKGQEYVLLRSGDSGGNKHMINDHASFDWKFGNVNGTKYNSAWICIYRTGVPITTSAIMVGGDGHYGDFYTPQRGGVRDITVRDGDTNFYSSPTTPSIPDPGIRAWHGILFWYDAADDTIRTWMDGTEYSTPQLTQALDMEPEMLFRSTTGGITNAGGGEGLAAMCIYSSNETGSQIVLSEMQQVYNGLAEKYMGTTWSIDMASAAVSGDLLQGFVESVGVFTVDKAGWTHIGGADPQQALDVEGSGDLTGSLDVGGAGTFGSTVTIAGDLMLMPGKLSISLTEASATALFIRTPNSSGVVAAHFESFTGQIIQIIQEGGQNKFESNTEMAFMKDSTADISFGVGGGAVEFGNISAGSFDFAVAGSAKFNDTMQVAGFLTALDGIEVKESAGNDGLIVKALTGGSASPVVYLADNAFLGAEIKYLDGSLIFKKRTSPPAFGMSVGLHTGSNTLIGMNAGMVGIANSTPSSTLDVLGNMEIEGGYLEMTRITTPGSTPSAGAVQLFLNTTSGLVSALKDDNTVVSLESAGGADTDAIHDNIGSEISAIAEKTTVTTGDLIIIEDSESSNAKKKVQLGNLPTGSGTDANAIHDNVASEISAITTKTTLTTGDFFILEDSEDTNAKKKCLFSQLGGGGGGTTRLGPWNVDLPLDSPATGDDDFSTTSLTAVNAWVENDPSGNHTYTAQSWGLQSDGAAASDLLLSYLTIAKPAASTTYTIVGKFNIMSQAGFGDNAWHEFGIGIMEDTGGGMAGAGMVGVSVRYETLQAPDRVSILPQNWTDYANFLANLGSPALAGSTSGTNPADASVALPLYLRVRKLGTTYGIDYSNDGKSWRQLYSGAAAAVTSNDDEVGFWSRTNGVPTDIISCEWFRVIDGTAAFNQQPTGKRQTYLE